MLGRRQFRCAVRPLLAFRALCEIALERPGARAVTRVDTDRTRVGWGRRPDPATRRIRSPKPRGGPTLPVREQLEPIWEDIRAELRRQAPDFKFHIWRDPLDLAGIEGSTLFVRAPEHIRSWVAERYLPLLREAAASSWRPGARV